MFQYAKFIKKEGGKMYWEVKYSDLQKIIKYCWLNKMYNIDLTMDFKSEKYIIALPYSAFYNEKKSFIHSNNYWFSIHVHKKQLMMC